MLIYLKGCYTILGEVYSDSKKSRLRFSVPIEKNKPAIVVEIMPGENCVEALDETEVSTEMWGVLQSDLVDGTQLSPDLQAELSTMTSRIREATRKVLSLIKYWFGYEELAEGLYSGKGTYWSSDRTEWKPLPQVIRAFVGDRALVCLNEKTVQDLQRHIEDGPEPFLALKHLHRAPREPNPSYRWIDATTAAELAIKEFLIRRKPDMETLLLEVPSPPLHKLYGSILESLVGVKSPKRKEIQKGVETRNKLVHRPQEMDIGIDEANEYVRDIEIAIYHLMSLLYPDDPFIKIFPN